MSEITIAIISGAIIAALIFAAAWVMHYLIETALSPSAEELAARHAEKLAKQATKEFKRRQRLRAVRF